MKSEVRQPWIHSATIDGAFILAPGFVATAASLALIEAGHGGAGLSLWMWGILIVGIDVAHVYSTLYRTYLDPVDRSNLSGWLILTPLAGWALGVLLYSWSAAAFWTLLAYIAVFHFVRQQYGFLMLYSRRERAFPKWCSAIDQIAIYAATLGPLVYWHTHLPRRFVWFIDGDFLKLPDWVWRAAWPVYALILAAYLLKECWLVGRQGRINVPRNVVVIGTAASWCVGIIVATGDLVFTMTNVVAHGIPYMALTFIYARGEERRREPRARPILRWLPLAIGLLVLLAFLEEGLWDGLVWREHLAMFPGFAHLPAIDTDAMLAVIVPLLAVPQLTHYVIDGVIWRLKAHPEWRRTLFWHGEPAAGGS
ncbi:MAG: hypothetical protein ABSH33_04920 [Steroidobacteraceae bacterium]|jgi:hypothetical protein